MMKTEPVPPGPGDLDIDVAVNCSLWDDAVPDAAALARTAAEAAWRAARAGTGGQATEASIVLADDAFVQTLNRDYRDRDKPTNVLSFPVDDPPGITTGILGDILVCPAVLRREVAGSETPLAAHWAHMVVHGVLHLCGYDHQSECDAGVMEGLESDVLQGFGFTNPYRVS